MNGKVILVSAGPGDGGLLTLRGKQALERAEVVVYDRLVGAEVMEMIPDSAEKINVGKTSGHHPIPQHEINRILCEQAQKGKSVVRLKGGDSYLFGRGGEECEELIAHGIDFEVVPGVTSAIAAPAYAGIPVTHRDCASSVHIITGHKKKDGVLNLDYEALVRVGGTLVFLMSVTSAPEILNGLMDAGMSGDMPAAMVENGTRPQQKKLISTVAQLAEDRQGIKSPAILIVGRVCALPEQLDWYSRRPLRGVRIAVTRPKERAGTLTARLRELGAEVISYPCIRTERIAPNPELTAVLYDLSAYQWLVLTSPAGADALFDALFECGLDARALAQLKIAVIGAGTAKQLRKYGICADFMPETYDSTHLAAGLCLLAREGERMLLLRAEEASAELTAALNAGGIAYDDIPLYRTIYRSENSEELEERLEDGTVDYVTFTSASTVKAFAASLPGTDFSSVTGVCIGRQTEAEAKQYGIHTILAKNADLTSMIEAIQEDRKNGTA